MSSEVWPGGHPCFHKRRTGKQWTILQDLALCKAGKLDVKDLQPEKEQLIKHPLYVWFRLAYNYARTEVTVPTDKLVAISGLTRGLQLYINATHEDYVAGVWKQTLPHGFLWYAPNGTQTGKELLRPEKYQAPSWSWASVNWTVTTDENDFKIPHDILIKRNDIKFNIMLASQDPFGEVKPGSSTTFEARTYNASISWTGWGAQMYDPPYLHMSVGKFGNGAGDTVCLDEKPDEMNRKDKKGLRLLPVLSSSVQSRWVQALILEPTRGEGVYRRFGYLRMAGPGSKGWFNMVTGKFVGAAITGSRDETIILV
jgi:hypothetical protein